MKEDPRGDRETQGSTALFKPGPPPGLQPYYLDVGAFEDALDNALKKDVVAGYVAQLRQSGQILFTKTWQYAKRPQDDGGEWWTVCRCIWQREQAHDSYGHDGALSR